MVSSASWQTSEGATQSVCVVCDKYGNPGALPPFPAWEGVLATEIGDPRLMVGSDIMGDEVDNVTRSIIKYEGVALSDVVLANDEPNCNRASLD